MLLFQDNTNQLIFFHMKEWGFDSQVGDGRLISNSPWRICT